MVQREVPIIIPITPRFFTSEFLLFTILGDLGDIKSAMGNNADVNFCDKDMRGALYYAIQEKSIPIVEFLLSKGADAAIQDCNGDTLMHIAADTGYKNMV
jgi:ankyrin repeat protein